MVLDHSQLATQDPPVHFVFFTLIISYIYIYMHDLMLADAMPILNSHTSLICYSACRLHCGSFSWPFGSFATFLLCFLWLLDLVSLNCHTDIGWWGQTFTSSYAYIGLLFLVRSSALGKVWDTCYVWWKYPTGPCNIYFIFLFCV